ncbi:MAG: DUF192 domain-containing protein [Actinomycetota bacterium]
MKRLGGLWLVLMLSCGPGSPLIRGFPEGELTIINSRGSSGGARFSLRVEIAESPRERSIGLMGIEGIDADVGMVFLFEEPTQNPFFMKNTLFELDIAFWDENMQIVDILTMTPCKKDPCPLYSPSARYVGAVEVRRGTFSRNGMRIGTTVVLKR